MYTSQHCPMWKERKSSMALIVVIIIAIVIIDILDIIAQHIAQHTAQHIAQHIAQQIPACLLPPPGGGACGSAREFERM